MVNSHGYNCNLSTKGIYFLYFCSSAFVFCLPCRYALVYLYMRFFLGTLQSQTTMTKSIFYCIDWFSQSKKKRCETITAMVFHFGLSFSPDCHWTKNVSDPFFNTPDFENLNDSYSRFAIFEPTVMPFFLMLHSKPHCSTVCFILQYHHWIIRHQIIRQFLINTAIAFLIWSSRIDHDTKLPSSSGFNHNRLDHDSVTTIINTAIHNRVLRTNRPISNTAVVLLILILSNGSNAFH